MTITISITTTTLNLGDDVRFIRCETQDEIKAVRSTGIIIKGLEGVMDIIGRGDWAAFKATLNADNYEVVEVL